ncbi:YtxH domain-containing protein [Jeotgalibacillus proteolyticus]|uniref:YtxH domain-containing protein n=1 Tax=Jeotgalibacillus proteolyticus TaxID=2082395 RepID=UPI003CE81194
MAGNKLSTGILLGAVIGGAVSLFDKETRRSTIEAYRKSSRAISYYSTHPKELSQQTKSKVEKIKVTVEQIQEDFEFLSAKLDEVKDMTPQLKNILVETKETFETSGETYKHALSSEESEEQNRSDLFLERNSAEGKKMV